MNILLELQKTDNEIMLMEQSKCRIPQEIEDAKEELKKAEEELKASQSRYDDYKTQIKLKEGEIEDCKQKAVKNTLKQNEVKTNEEYRALLNENEHIRKKVDTLEEEIIIMLDKTDSFKKEISTAKADLENETKKHQQVEVEKNNQLRDIENKVVEYKEKRTKLAKLVNEDNYKEYKKLMKLRSNKAVSVIDINGICPECSVLIPPQIVNEVISEEETKFCPNCHRMLYYSENEQK